MMKASEYRIANQLAKVPAQISLMGLLLTSDHHKDTLFKILKEIKVLKGIATDKLRHVVNSVFAIDQISFSP
mgnify:CR=1 FL=1